MRKAAIIFVVSVSVCPCPRRTAGLILNGFYEIWCINVFRKCVENIHYNLTRITGTLHEDQCVFLIIRGLLEKYPTFGREKETGLLGALDT